MRDYSESALFLTFNGALKTLDSFKYLLYSIDLILVSQQSAVTGLDISWGVHCKLVLLGNLLLCCFNIFEDIFRLFLILLSLDILLQISLWFICFYLKISTPFLTKKKQGHQLFWFQRNATNIHSNQKGGRNIITDKHFCSFYWKIFKYHDLSH